MPYAVIVVDQDQFLARAEERALVGDQVLIVRAAEDIAHRLVEIAKGLAPKRTGRLAAEGIDARVEEATKSTIKVIAGLKREPAYGIIVHEGSGIFGDFHRPIFVGHGNVMHFLHDGKDIFARHVLGQRPHPFMREATLLVENTYIPVRLQELGAELSHV